MALITCPECEKQISEHAVSCPNCGFQLSHEIVSKQKEIQKKHSFHDSFDNVELETHGFHDFFKDSPPLKTVLKQEEGQHGFHNSDKNSPLREKATILSLLQKPRPIAGIITFLIIIISLLIWNLYNSKDGSNSSKENINDIIKSSTNIPAKPNLERVDLAVEREKRRKKIDSINIESNRIANVAIGDMPKGSINVDTLMRVYKKMPLIVPN